MGKVEKVIVLSVLFLIALILVVSLTVDDPLDKSRVVEAGTTPHGPVATPNPVPDAGPNTLANAGSTPGLTDPKSNPSPADVPSLGGTSAPGLISMPIHTDGDNIGPGGTTAIDPKSAAPATASGLPAGALLKKLDGLQDSILPDMKLYTWQPNDNYRRIADKYYGDWNKFTVLRRSNEGRTDVQPGEQIFVPVFDTDAAVATATPIPAAPQGKKVADRAGKKTAPKTAASAPKGTGNKTHVVKSGESLWKIAHTELGDGSRWQEIYDLNKDVLASAKSVHAGQTLRIP
jgi:nucleoid-associated protein YgaU